MRAELAIRQLTDRRRGLIGWALGLVAYVVLIVSIFPTIRDSSALVQAIEEYPDAVLEFLGGAGALDFSTGAGFVNAELFSLVLPALLAIVAIGMGASLGADQRSGLLDLVLANPVSRRQVVLERAAAITVAVAGLAVVVAATLVVSDWFVDLGIGVAALVAASTSVVLLVLIHGFVALAVGGATGRRSSAIGAATFVFAVGYVISGLGGLVEWLEPWRVVAPYHHAIGTNPLVDGWDIVSIVVLSAMAAGVLLTADLLFERRDIV